MNQEKSTDRPLVSVILATYNEARTIQNCLNSILSQETPDFDLEILAIDGKSTDGTREILEKIAAFDPRVRVIVNEKRKTPYAFNLGLREARGDYVCIFGSHTIYSRDYISVCRRELIAQGASGCGGRVITTPCNNSLEARLVAWTLSHPFGSSRKSFRTQPEGYANLINYPVMLKQPLIEVGGYDEELTRNQDNDMNQKLRAQGYKLYCTWKTCCFYQTKAAVRGLLEYAFRCGFWNAISFRKNIFSLRFYHLVPFFFVTAMALSSGLAVAGLFSPQPFRGLFPMPAMALLGLHLGAGLIAAGQVSIRERSLGALLLPLIFLAFHFSYGLGTLWAFLTGARPASPERLEAGKAIPQQEGI